jgi:hypothetical protein
MPFDKTHFEQVPLETVRKIVSAESEQAVPAARPQIEPPIAISRPVKPAVKRVRS